MFPNTATKKREDFSEEPRASTGLSKVLFFIWSFLRFFPSTNLKDQYHGKLRYMDGTASLLVGDLSVFLCLIAPWTNHGSVHSLGAGEGQDQKKIYTLFYTSL